MSAINKKSTKCVLRFSFVCYIIDTFKFPAICESEVYRDVAENDQVMMLLYKLFQKIILGLVLLIQFCPMEFKYESSIYNLCEIIHQR